MNLNLFFLKSMNLNLNLVFFKSMNLNLKIKNKMNGSNPIITNQQIMQMFLEKNVKLY